jgi:hypothetical protein
MAQADLSREMLIVFTRFPQPGQTKTRLIPALGMTGAANLQRMMAEYTFAQCCELANKRNLSIAVHYEGGNEQELQRWIPASMICQPQSKGSLGERLAHSFASSFHAGMEHVIIVGSDCPFLTPEILASGFDLLQESDLVLGPAYDGGYYLIGLSKADHLLWADIDWGTAKVLSQTIEIARKKGLALALLPTLADIDRPEDLQNLHGSSFALHFPTSNE